MELKTFAEEDFDPKKWINKAWSTNGNQEKEIFVSNTVNRLQLYMKQMTNSLDETSTQIVTSIPRILKDASSLQLEGALLQQKLVLLEQMVRDVEERTGSSIESLQRIDQLKSRLESAASALREADKWAALAAGLEDMLEAGVPTGAEQLAELAERVSAMTGSLEVLSDAPDYENKRLQLETLYNRLEASITPPLIEALTQMDPGRTRSYVSVLAGMSRQVSACRCWRRAAAARLSAAWRRLDAPTVAALTNLLADEANKQVDWLTNVLKTDTPLGELIRLYTDLLLSLEPSPIKVVSAKLKLCSSPDEGINQLIDLRTDINEFISCIRAVIDAPRPNKEILMPATIREFGRAAYAPLRELLPKYTELQQQILLGHLSDPQLRQDDLLEKSRALLSVCERCDSWMGAACSKAEKIAGVAAYLHYIPALDNFVTAISYQISTHTRIIETAFLSGKTGGVLSDTFPASLVLEAAVKSILDALSARTPPEEDELKHQHQLSDVATFLLESEARARIAARRAEPWPVAGALRRTKDTLRTLARNIVRHPVDQQLDKITQLPVWSNNDSLATDLPDFALSPQEYITEIGQYLMTLPQHLEMHLSEKQAPWQFLSEVCTHTCELYAEKILNIRNMDALGTKRCLTDIVYLSSVVEDLGTNVTPSLKNLEKSLRAATPSQAE